MTIRKSTQTTTKLRKRLTRAALEGIPSSINIEFLELNDYPYYSLYYFGIDRSTRVKAMILVAPILAHGIFDGILLSMRVDEGLATIFTIAFLVFFIKLKNKGKERIEKLMNQ